MCETSKGKAFGEHFWKTRGYWVFCESSPPWPVLCEAVTGHLADQVSDWLVKCVWIWNDQVNRKCTESEPQMKCKCMEWNKNARRVPRECPPRAGCRPKSHFYPKCFYIHKAPYEPSSQIYLWSNLMYIKGCKGFWVVVVCCACHSWTHQT